MVCVCDTIPYDCHCSFFFFRQDYLLFTGPRLSHAVVVGFFETWVWELGFFPTNIDLIRYLSNSTGRLFAVKSLV